MKVISSRQNAKVKELIAYKKNPKDFILIEGQHLIEMAHKANLIVELYGYEPLFPEFDITIISKEVAAKLSDKVTTDGYFALIRAPRLEIDKTKNLLYLDSINDPGNMGTIMRTAIAFGFGGILLSERCVNVFNPKVLSAAQGAHFVIPMKITTFTELLSYRKADYKIAVTTLEKAETIDKVGRGKLILVLGNEARGVSKDIIENADYLVKIPIDNIESLNVAIAGAILMYEISKRK